MNSHIISPFYQGAKTVMLVEDEPMVRSVLCRVLQENSYIVLEATNGSEAVVLAEAFGFPIHLLVTDLSMPEMNGYVLADRMASLHPEAQVLFLSGFIDGIIPGHEVLESTSAFLQKPFRPELFLQKVFEVLNQVKEEQFAPRG